MFDSMAEGVRDLADARPGPDSVAALATLDLDTLSADAQVDALMATERQIAWLQGMQQRVLAGIDARLAASAPRARPALANLAREEVGCALRLAPQTAADRLAIAGTLCDRRPRRCTRWSRARSPIGTPGRWPRQRFGSMRRAPRGSSKRCCSTQASRVWADFRTAVAEALLAIDPAPAEQRHDRALADRCVRIRPAEDGLASLWALLPAEGTAALMQAVDALASVTSADDVRTCDQRRADALVDLGAAALHDPALPRAQGLRPHVQVTIALSTLLGLDEHPAELAGHGPIPAELARRIAADPTGTWRRLVLDPVHHRLLDYARRTYRPPADLTRFVIARDQRCAFPQCRRNAAHCDLDHQIRYADGGVTSADNLAPLCPRHHAVKDDGGWRVTRQPDGDYRWTSPTGRTYTASPPRYPNPPPPDDSVFKMRIVQSAPPEPPDPDPDEPPPF